MPKNPKPVRSRKKDEREYAKGIEKEILDPLLTGILDRLEGARKMKGAWLKIIEDEFAEKAKGTGTIAKTLAEGAVNNARAYQKGKMIKAFKAAVGVDILPLLSDLAIRPTMLKYLDDNIDLIVSIPGELLPEVLSGFEMIFDEHGFDQERLLKFLDHDFQISHRRAQFIARDQVQKIIGNLNEQRQMQVGVTRYIWRNVGDELVVGNPAGKYPKGNPGHMDHWTREGQVFYWAVPPPDGHPGFSFN